MGRGCSPARLPRVSPTARVYGARVTNRKFSSGDISHVYREELGPGQRSALLSWLAFAGTFAGLRGLTYSIRVGKGPFRNISVNCAAPRA